MLRRLGAIGAALAVLLLGLAPASQASVSIAVPANANLGSASIGATLTAQLGSVTASGSGLLGVDVTASVACSDFKTGSGTAAETISKTNVFYWSGPATATGLLSSVTPGQPTSANQVSCATSHQAFWAGAPLTLLSASVTWNPTIVINLPASAVAGTYTGTVTHTVV